LPHFLSFPAFRLSPFRLLLTSADGTIVKNGARRNIIERQKGNHFVPVRENGGASNIDAVRAVLP